MKTEKVFKFICVGGYREEREALLSLIQLHTEKVHKFFGKEEIVLKKSIHFWSDKEFRFSRNLYRQILPQKK